VRIKNRNIAVGFAVMLGIMLFMQSGCVKQHTNQPLPNKTPLTFFWVYSDTAVAQGVSKQELRWWGEDQDGYVVGYLLAIVPNLTAIPNPDTLTYSYVTTTDSIISFPLRQAKQTFLVAVHAIDNTFTYPLPVGAVIKLSPFVFWDKNNNGIFDSTDVRLDNLSSSMDPNGAKQRFPTVNTPPTISYVPDANVDTLYAQPPPITFTVASFSWAGADFDGNETIAGYQISLNDSTFANPLVVSSSVTTITLSVPRDRSDAAGSTVTADVLTGVSPNLHLVGTLAGLNLDGNNKLYVKTVDVAGALSNVLQFPTNGRNWFVKKPRGKMLLVIDYVGGGDSSSVRTFYTDSVFNKITGLTYDILNLRDGTMLPAYQHTNPALTKTLKLYNCVYWYTDPSPSLVVSRQVLFDYWSSNDGGHLIYSTRFVGTTNPDAGHAYRDIAPLDSLGSAPINATRENGALYPDSTVATKIYPVLSFRKIYVAPTFPLFKNAAAKNIYYYPANATYGDPKTCIGVIDDTKRVIFVSFPLDKMFSGYSDGQGVRGFFQQAFADFGFTF
jgi:hypothetical protein